MANPANLSFNKLTQISKDGTFEGEPANIRDDALLGTLPPRSSFVTTCQKWMDAKQPRYLVWRVNPKDVSWHMTLRQVDQQTRIGIVSHVWKDPLRKSYYNEPVLRFTLQSGNIMPIPTLEQQRDVRLARISSQLESQSNNLAFDADIAQREAELAKGLRDGTISETGAFYKSAVEGINNDKKLRSFQREAAAVEASNAAFAKTSAQTPEIPPGLANFYDFLDLMNEQRIIDDPKSPSFGRVNLIYLMYHSRIFPDMVLAGVFTPDGMSWTDSSADPNQVDAWSVSFTVYHTYPELTASQLMGAFADAGFCRVA